MPSTFSPLLRIELIAPGSQSGVWGNTTNNNLGDLIEQAITGATEINVTGADVTLTALNGVTDQARSAVLIVTGTPSVTRVITIPNANKSYTVKNRSNATVNIKTSSGSPFAVPTLSESYLYCDGANVISGRVITDGANAVTSLPNPFNNAALTGVPTTPTATLGTNTTQVASTAHVFAERTNTATLTNKTLTSPAITTPTGIVKGDVGLGNVDNTSDATKNSATATLTNKTLTSPVVNTPNLTGGTINNATIGASTPSTVASTNFSYTGTLTGGTGVINIGSGQVVKDASGNVGIGTSSPVTKLDVVSAPNAGIRVTDGTQQGIIFPSTFGGVVYGTTSNHPMILFTNNTERARIDASGNLLVGATSPVNSSINGSEINSTTISNSAPSPTANLVLYKPASAALSAFVLFNTNGSFIGAITQNGNSAVAYNTTSDYRLKENVMPMVGALARVTSLNPVTYTWKSTGEVGQGFIAHELQAIVPDAVTGTKDAVDKDGKPQYQGVDTSFLVATLTAAIQELSAKVDTLQAELNTLKGN